MKLLLRNQTCWTKTVFPKRHRLNVCGPVKSATSYERVFLIKSDSILLIHCNQHWLSEELLCKERAQKKYLEWDFFSQISMQFEMRHGQTICGTWIRIVCWINRHDGNRRADFKDVFLFFFPFLHTLNLWLQCYPALFCWSMWYCGFLQEVDVFLPPSSHLQGK